jgi:hypothetical protein
MSLSWFSHSVWQFEIIHVCNLLSILQKRKKSRNIWRKTSRTVTTSSTRSRPRPRRPTSLRENSTKVSARVPKKVIWSKMKCSNFDQKLKTEVALACMVLLHNNSAKVRSIQLQSTTNVLHCVLAKLGICHTQIEL